MTVEELFEKCKTITEQKLHDYTSVGSLAGPGRFENFERSAMIASWFKSDFDKPYVVLIATKLTRLATLLDAKTPKNESVEDSFIDLVNYCALWGSARSLHSAEIAGLFPPLLPPCDCTMIIDSEGAKHSFTCTRPKEQVVDCQSKYLGANGDLISCVETGSHSVHRSGSHMDSYRWADTQAWRPR